MNLAPLRMPFGKFKGRTLDAVPDYWLAWFIHRNRDERWNWLVKAIQDEIARREGRLVSTARTADVPLADAMLQAIRDDRHDLATRAALTDLLVDEGPEKPDRQEPPNWLRLAIFWAIRERKLPWVRTFGRDTSAAALQKLVMAWDRVRHSSVGFDHHGRVRALDRWCFVNEPYSDMESLQAMAAWLEDALWPCCITLVLAEGAHMGLRTPRLLMIPLDPPPKVGLPSSDPEESHHDL